MPLNVGSGNQYLGIPSIFLLVALFRSNIFSLLTLLIRTPKNIWRSVAATDLEETAVQHIALFVQTIYPLTIDTLIKWLHDKGVNERLFGMP